MASLSAVRAAIKTTLTEAIPGLTCYDHVPDAANLPAAVVLPATADFIVAMGRSLDTWELDVIVLVSAGDPGIGQTTLDGYVSGAGSKSIREAIFKARTLGLAKTDAHVSAMTTYNMQFSAVQLDHIAATLRLVVRTDGTV